MQNLSEAEVKRVQATLEGMKEKASEDPIYFIDTFCYTFNPKLPKGQSPHLRFKLFPFQKRLVRDILKSIRDGEDLFIEKSREVGATYTILATILWMWRYEPGSNVLVGSRKEDYVDNRRGGTTGNKEESLFGKLDYMLSRLPDFMLPKGFDRNRHFTYMSLINPENGNVVSGESANQNFSRGSRHRMIFLDEFAFWDHGIAVWGATADTTNCRIIATTPGDRPSKAKRLRFGKDGEKIKVVTLTYNQDPRKTKKWLETQRDRRSSEDFNREIMINWETSITGRVYPEMESAAFGEFPFLVNKQLYCSWDFGLDGTALIFWQQNPANGKWRIVDCFESQDKVIQWYYPLFGKPMDSKFQYTDDDIKAVTDIAQYPPAIHFGDPDVNKRSYLVKDTTTRQELEKVGVFVQSIPKNDFTTRREKTKIALQKGIEVDISARTEYLMECLKSARYPQREETSQSTQPVSLPIHDWTSHFRTSMEYFFTNIDIWSTKPKDAPKWADQTKSWLTNRMRMKSRRG